MVSDSRTNISPLAGVANQETISF